MRAFQAAVGPPPGTMRIIHVANVRWFNATSWYALFLCRLLRDAGHEVLALTLEGTETHAKALEWELPVQTLDLNAKNPFALTALYTRLDRLVQTWQPDVVNCHRGESFLHWGLLRRLRGSFRLVRTRGDQREPKNNLPNRWLHCHAADAVVATNSRTMRAFREKLKVPADRLWLILGGVDADKFRFDPEGRERVRAEFGFAPGDLVIGLLGRFDWVKGQEEAIAAVAELIHGRGLTHVRLFLMGFETETPEATVRGWIAEHGLEPYVRISGFHPDVTACISACDMGLVASRFSETIARAALEIMACGRPLVSTDVGVMPDLLDAEALVPPRDVPALAGLLARAATDEGFRERLAARQELVMEGLTARDFLQRTLAVYEHAWDLDGGRRLA